MGTALWTSAGFLDEARRWVQHQLEPGGVRLTGDVRQPHVRTWSSAVRFATSAGPVWFKVNGPGTAYEPALVRLLHERLPTLLPEVLAVDVERAWSLTRDGGAVLREALPADGTSADRSWQAWEGVVARYAEAQLRLAGEREAVLATGARDLSPGTLTARAEALVEELSGRSVDDGGLSADEVTRLTGVLPLLERWCAELASCGVPDSVQHDDLHAGNVCWTGSAAAARIIDWGDTGWAFPLTTMLVTMRSLAFHAGLPVDAPRVLRVRDAYLEPFTSLASRADLERLVDVARGTGCVGRALSYRGALQEASTEEHRQLDFPVRDWLLTLLDARGELARARSPLPRNTRRRHTALGGLPDHPGVTNPTAGDG